MKVIVTLAGIGKRFADVGYTDIKALIKICGKPMIDYVCSIYPKDTKFIFVCREEDLHTTNLKEVLSKFNGTVVGIESHRKGPVYTISKVFDLIDDDEPIVVNYCDCFHVWDWDSFMSDMVEKKVDGCILTHVGFHPHRLNNVSFAFLKNDGEKVLEIQEKKAYTDNPFNEHASNGTYYFRTGKMVKQYFTELMEKNINLNGEFYVTLPFNLMIRDGLNVILYESKYFVCTGIPEDIQNFESWMNIIKWNQVKTGEDAQKVWKYWNEFTQLYDVWRKYEDI